MNTSVDRFDVFETDLTAQAPLITRERHRVLLEAACDHLDAFLSMRQSLVNCLGVNEERIYKFQFGRSGGRRVGRRRATVCSPRGGQGVRRNRH